MTLLSHNNRILMKNHSNSFKLLITPRPYLTFIVGAFDLMPALASADIRSKKLVLFCTAEMAFNPVQSNHTHRHRSNKGLLPTILITNVLLLLYLNQCQPPSLLFVPLL